MTNKRVARFSDISPYHGLISIPTFFRLIVLIINLFKFIIVWIVLACNSGSFKRGMLFKSVIKWNLLAIVSSFIYVVMLAKEYQVPAFVSGIVLCRMLLLFH